MKIKVLMVCLGNICRSPLAEGILRSKADSSNVFVDSAGTAGYHIGKGPDPRSVEVAQKHHIDISRQRCRKFKEDDYFAFDHILVMDRENYINVCALAPSEAHKKKVRLLLEGSGLPYSEVPDPYYGGQEGFEKVYDLIDKACNMLLPELTSSKKQPHEK
ncbi:MAG: low molecular weight protein-tyrosine-phosphatase [Muriicola sp.]